MKIYRDKNDELFSKIIRLQANGICQRCLKPTDFKRLQAAHFHGRAIKKVRWDLSNAVALCYGCHAYIDGRATEKIEFFKKRLGETEYENLKKRAYWPSKTKIDKKAIELFLNFKLKELENAQISGGGA
jgi:5-methylcytosine-specific restriction endonuclease McrA